MSEFTEGDRQIAMVGPDGWQQIEGIFGTLVAYVGASGEPDAFRPNVNLLVQPNAEPVQLDDLLARHGATLAVDFKDGYVIDEGLATVGEHEASRVLLTYTLNGDDLTLEQWMVPLGTDALVLSATCLTGDYPGLVETFQDVVASVELDA